MPQMSPLNWVILFSFFTLMYLIINSMNYYLVLYTNQNKTNLLKINSNNWKW
uniref:ATP synthase complex subunit 8 n=1 Tax=Chaetosoma scaritides TaxID=546502 RepID=B6D8W0_9CUCU|nr:ATP synthase F0 subunit 8 [Chaetosoma scaritides]ACF35098.1 ATP synthase F0 subunit 8 [Chaetosoma scaritides]